MGALQPNLGMILNRTYSDPSCLGATAAAGTNNLRRTDSNLSMMTDDSASELATAHAHGGAAGTAANHHQDPPAIATNGTGVGRTDAAGFDPEIAVAFLMGVQYRCPRLQ